MIPPKNEGSTAVAVFSNLDRITEIVFSIGLVHLRGHPGTSVVGTSSKSIKSPGGIQLTFYGSADRNRDHCKYWEPD